MQNRRTRTGNRRKAAITTGSNGQNTQNRRLRKLDRRVDSIQAAFVNMQK